MSLQDGQAGVHVFPCQEVVSLKVNEVADANKLGPCLLFVLGNSVLHLLMFGEVEAAHHALQEARLLGLVGFKMSTGCTSTCSYTQSTSSGQSL